MISYINKSNVKIICDFISYDAAYNINMMTSYIFSSFHIFYYCIQFDFKITSNSLPS